MTTNVFAAFEKKQIQEFKEAFNLLDDDKDGFVNMTDLETTFGSFGKVADEDQLREMLQLPGMPDDGDPKLNFTMFLTMFAQKLNGMDPEDVILDAFKCLDIDGTGKFF